MRLRLFFKQSDEVGLKQGKISDTLSSSTDLSTETVDAFSLVPAALPLQRR
jgi:hypothetical protein